MARDKRSRPSPTGTPPPARPEDTPIDPDVAMFAARTFERQAAERDAKQAQRDARRREEEHQVLISTKDAAASEVKRLRTLERVQPTEAAAAEAAYRNALADLISFETGSAPAWAPAVPAESATEPESAAPSESAESAESAESTESTDSEGEDGEDAEAATDEA